MTEQAFPVGENFNLVSARDYACFVSMEMFKADFYPIGTDFENAKQSLDILTVLAIFIE